tara:strand:- start:427 stop:711 length:285 start_codon:yes stop_codon:yes gene_type:complete
MKFIVFIAKFIGTLILALVYTNLLVLLWSIIAIDLFGFEPDQIRHRIYVFDGEGNIERINNYFIYILYALTAIIGFWLAFKTTKIPPFDKGTKR